MTTGVQQRNIIIFILILFLASSIWLFSVAEKYTDPDYQKNWWAVYFSDPKSDSLDFVIENHSDKTNFHWEILVDKKKIREGDAEIIKGDIYNSQVQSSTIEPHSSGKITVQVSAGEEKKEIYKSL